jgi:peptide-methionine (R)-S-oxide reductase
MGTFMNGVRRLLLGLGGLAGGGALLQGLLRGESAGAATPRVFEVTRTDAQWRESLTPAQYRVLRQAGTEYPHSSPLDREKRAGRFTCAGCSLPLFSSETKFDSRTGRPSFWTPLDDAVVEASDMTMGMKRVEVLCRRCGGHLGHVFDDGPPPTGLRYCMNGLAMNFTPRTEDAS